jgi:hypothetical protein
LVAIVVAGPTFTFGEDGSKRVSAGVLFGAGMAIAAVNFLSWLFPCTLNTGVPQGEAYGGDRESTINRVDRSLSLTILGPKRKLFFFALCFGAATKNGHRFLTDTQSAGKGEVLYHGFTRPREATKPISTGLHQKAAEKIEGQ